MLKNILGKDKSSLKIYDINLVITSIFILNFYVVYEKLCVSYNDLYIKKNHMLAHARSCNPWHSDIFKCDKNVFLSTFSVF